MRNLLRVNTLELSRKEVKLQINENEVLAGKSVVLDDKHFANCEYTNCTLVYSGGDFGMVNTKFQDCRVAFAGAAQRTANLIEILGIAKNRPPEMLSVQ